MVRDGDRLHPHVFREFVVTGEIRDGIHRGHLGMQVEFHALLFQGWVVIARLGGGQAIHEMATDGFLFRVIVDVDGTTDADAGPDRNGCQHLFRHPFRVREATDRDGVGAIPDAEDAHLSAFAGVADVRLENLAAKIDVA